MAKIHVPYSKDGMDLNIEDKKIDLYIWNAIFSKEIIRHGISKKYLHTLYNKYYVTLNTFNYLILQI